MRSLAPSEKQKLICWFKKNQRPLPWRESKDPYRIWLSETMLQQTTSTAVIPYFHRFLGKFPTLQSLSKAPIEDVLELWSGLGYYSRARNLHRAAMQLSQSTNFPQTHSELLGLPGFGPYTARAVSSLAFGEPVGVLDGNVIRVLSRYFNWPAKWWATKDRKQLQLIIDQWVKNTDSGQMNQAVMELGATICTPKSPTCLLCPLHSSCRALTHRTIAKLPLKKGAKKKTLLLWSVRVVRQGQKIALIKNTELPFLKGHWVLPGTHRQIKRAPPCFDFRHQITHYEIYVRKISTHGARLPILSSPVWVRREEVGRMAPASLIQKVLALHYD